MDVQAMRAQALEEGRAVRARCVARGQPDSQVVSGADPDVWQAEVAAAYRAGFSEGARPPCGGECAGNGRGALLCCCVPPF